MGFASGSISFQRFFLSGEHPQRLTDEWLAALHDNAHGRRGYDPKRMIESGWIVPDHLFDVDFSSAHRVTCGPFVFLGLRVDRLAPPPAVVAGYRRIEELALVADAGEGIAPNRAQRRLAKEAADRRAQEEAREGAFRRIRAYPLLIDLEEGIAYFGNTGRAAAEELNQLFTDSFGVTLVPATPSECAARWAENKARTRWLDDALPFALVEPPGDAESGSALAFPGADRAFLGREFLGWLWHRCDVGEGMFELNDRGGVSVAIHRQMALACVFQQSGNAAIRCDAPGASPEARAALRIGKLPTKLAMLVESAGTAWSVTVGDSGTVSGLALPPAEDVDSGWALLEHRFLSMREASRTLDGLYRSFLEIRLGEDWDAEHARMTHWARPVGAAEKSVRRATA